MKIKTGDIIKFKVWRNWQDLADGRDPIVVERKAEVIDGEIWVTFKGHDLEVSPEHIVEVA